MGDMGDAFREMREYQKTRRQSRLSQFTRDEHLIKNHPMVYILHTYSENHYGIELMHGKGLIQYWPSTAKWEYNKRIHHGTTEMLCNFIERRMKNLP